MKRNGEQEEEVFKVLLGSNHHIKILEQFLKDKEQTLNDIVKKIKINRGRGYQILKELQNSKVVVKVKKIKNIQFYNLNASKEEVKLISRLYNLLNEKNKNLEVEVK